MFVAVIVIFGICWLPYHVYFIYSYHDPTITRYILIPCLLYILLPRNYHWKVYTPAIILQLQCILLPYLLYILLPWPYYCKVYTPTYDPTITRYILIYDDLTITRFILLPRPYHYKGYTPTMILILQGKTIYQERICPGNRI